MNIQQDIADKIAQHGFMVMAVGGSHTEPSFAYTIGLTERGHPELIVFGLSARYAHQIIHNVLVEMASEVPADGVLVENVANMPLVLRTVLDTEAEKYCVQGAYYYNARLKAPRYMQLVLPDANGRFPWDDGYAATTRKIQPELWA
jgi:hypothetical protein